MTTTDTGRKAEAVAAEYLQAHDYEVLQQNWKTRFCEIDIVAAKDGCLYCVEVKYRQSTIAGSGLEYITQKKLQQMQFAAQSYAMEHNWHDSINLAAIEVAGNEYKITNFIESIY